ncbi:MAG: hypothetical protein CML88_02615 [Rhodobiaceae bacterium]|nr:hypothetical protein [Rhodobiaceae bacterium]
MKNTVRYILPIYAVIYTLVFSNTKRDNNFLGKWEIDVQKTLSSNNLPSGSNKSLNINPSDFIINFSLAGNYNEMFGGLKFEGTWSRYDLNLVVARLESDERIINLKKHLNQKIKKVSNNRNELTRLYQRIQRVNQMSIRTYTFKEGNIYLKHDGSEYVMVFRRAR